MVALGLSECRVFVLRGCDRLANWLEDLSVSRRVTALFCMSIGFNVGSLCFLNHVKFVDEPFKFSRIPKLTETPILISDTYIASEASLMKFRPMEQGCLLRRPSVYMFFFII